MGGGVHGIAQVIENMLIPKKYYESKGILWWGRVAIIFAFCSFAWIFFVSDSIGEANYVISHMFCNLSDPIFYLYTGFSDIGMDKWTLAIELCLLAILFIYDLLSIKMDVIEKISEKKSIVRWLIYIGMGLIIIFFSQKGVAAEFVYFQF